MRILQICSAKNFGGGERHVLDLTEGLQSSGHQVFLALSYRNNWRRKLERFDKSCICFLSMRNAVDFFGVWQLVKIIRRHDIEIIHAHVARDYPLAVFAALIAGNGVQVVITRHVLFPLKPLHKVLLKKVSAVVAVSRAVENNLLKQKIFSADKIKYIPNAIGPAAGRKDSTQKMKGEFRRTYNIAPNNLLISIIGEIKKLKGQEDFLHAAEIILQNYPGARFVIAGKDNSKHGEFRTRLIALANHKKLADKILWIDFVDDVSPLLSDSDVVVSASHSESFGMTILEAMSAGCAIVATETEGAREILQNDETGKIVPIQDSKKMAQAISEFLDSEQLRNNFGTAARKFAREKFPFAGTIGATEQTYLACQSGEILTEAMPVFGSASELKSFGKPAGF